MKQNTVHAEQKGQEVSPRPPSPKRVVIIQSDVEILRFVHEYRLLRIPQLELLTGRKYQQLAGRLKALREAGYLDRIAFPLKKHIFYIAKRGLDTLLREGLITDEQAARRVREGDLKDERNLDHEMMLSDWHLMLTFATSGDCRFELVDWREGKEIHDTFTTVVNGQTQQIRLEPDAFFTLRDRTRAENNTRSFLLEADRSTMGKKERPDSRRMNDKLWKYAYYIKEGRFKNLGVPAIRILTLTLTRGRRDSLASTAAEIIPEAYLKYFYYGTLHDLPLERPLSIFDPVFVWLKNMRKAHPLFPALAETAESG